MNELIDILYETTKDLIGFDMEQYTLHAQMVVDTMLAIVPAIISIYADPRMADMSSDALYWPSQVERVIKALEKGDDFSTMDILYNETRANLIELRDEITKRGIL